MLNKLRILVCLFFLILLVSCEKSVAIDENIYKKEAVGINNIINEYFKIKMNTKYEKHENNLGGTFIHQTAGREEYIRKSKHEWLNHYDALKKFIKDYPESKWVDDAAFCCAVEFVFVRTKNNYFNEEKKEAISCFLENYPYFKIEKWTKDSFAEILKLFYDGIPSDLLNKIKDIEIIRGRLFIVLITQYCIEQNYLKAEEILREFLKDKPEKYFADAATMTLSYYKEN